MHIKGVKFQDHNNASVFTQAKPEDTLDLCQLLNNDIAASVAKYPNRFVGLGTLPMQAPELAVKEMIRCKIELGKQTLLFSQYLTRDFFLSFFK